jgi:hypothetical protein
MRRRYRAARTSAAGGQLDINAFMLGVWKKPNPHSAERHSPDDIRAAWRRWKYRQKGHPQTEKGQADANRNADWIGGGQPSCDRR